MTNTNLNADLINAAVDAIAATAAFSHANPSVSLKLNPFVKPSNAATRKAFGSQNAVSSCAACGHTYPRVNADLKTACCNATLLVRK
jgi:hypothetical protein